MGTTIDHGSRTRELSAVRAGVGFLLTVAVCGCEALAQQGPPAPTPGVTSESAKRPRARSLGIRIGSLEPGPRNAITDVGSVRVAHTTIKRGDGVRTGVTVVVPHMGNLFRWKVPAAIVVGNGFGKLFGSVQVQELGELESPIALTNTLSVGPVADGLVRWMLSRPGNETVRSVNVVVGETNDGRLNDIRGRHVQAADVEAALRSALTAPAGPVIEGSVGAGHGTVCFGWKGGIGTSSRRVKVRGMAEEFTVGVLVQTNFGGRLTIAGRVAGAGLDPRRARGSRTPGGQAASSDSDKRGSCMIVVATDAPIGHRNLERIGRRALIGMGRTGASFSNGSGDFVIAFSTASELVIEHGAVKQGAPVLANSRMSGLFVAVADATEEAILNSLLRATTVESVHGRAEAIPIDRVRALLERR